MTPEDRVTALGLTLPDFDRDGYYGTSNGLMKPYHRSGSLLFLSGHVAMGAFKQIDAQHAEIKSMHVLAEARGRGLSQRMLNHLMAEAARAGFTRLSRETGVQPAFVVARALCLGGFCRMPAVRGVLG